MTTQVRKVVEKRTAAATVVDKKVTAQNQLPPRIPSGEKKEGGKLPPILASTLPTVNSQQMAQQLPTVMLQPAQLMSMPMMQNMVSLPQPMSPYGLVAW